MEHLSRAEIVRLVSLESGHSQRVIHEILPAYHLVLKQALLMGYKIGLNELGTITTTMVPAREEKMMYNLQTGEKELAPPRAAYNRPVFKFSDKVVKEMRNLTLGDVY